MSATCPARQAVPHARLDAMSPAKRALVAKRLAGRGARTGDSVVPVPRDGRFEVSAAQRRLWYMDQLSPGSAVFDLSVALRLTGPLKSEVLQTAVRQVFAQHESLRTVFPAPGGSPVRRILPEIEEDLTPVVLMDDAGAGAGLVAALEAEAARPFPFEHGPLARVRLFQCDPAEHVLLLVIHHSVCDGLSMSLVIDELMKLYTAGVRGAEAELEPLRVEYADHTAWEAEPRRDEELAPQLDYWRRTLRRAPATVDLPIDWPRAAVQSFRGTLHRFTLPSGIWPAVREVARAEQATPFTVLLAAFSTLLSRCSTQGEVTVATPVANRPQDEIQNVVGFFVNSIALRVDTSGNPAFSELVGRVRDVTQEALARSPAHAPIAQVSFALLDDRAMDDAIGGLRVTTVDHHTGTAKYDLTLELWPDSAGELHGTLEYATDLFAPTTVTELVRRFGTLLGHLAAEPGTAVGQVPLLPDEETRRIEGAWRAADGPVPFVGRCVHKEFERQVRRTADLPALVAGERTRTSDGEIDWPAFPHPTGADSAVPDGVADLPRTPLERTVAEVRGQVLGLPEVGRDADFLALGGHSLVATRAVARLRDALGPDIPLREFLRSSSPADLAARTEGLGVAPKRPRVVPTPRTCRMRRAGSAS
ncbi:condensation domain-containing protein [Streptomyces sp. SID12501]|uniref:Carrier domain-containing protein n=1 Tax=Streptomyces sp. SID12501 TaxID=2706042 RepID=A0A6B3BVW2_9ACTN|nr:condensation domain-containing protein [Streptomyces sp. SID12501]NEC88376.1 hypothetical protein [Streptomyces sp. SID12501]